RQRLSLGNRSSADNRADFGTGAEHISGLPADDVEMFASGYMAIPYQRELDDLALDHQPGHLRESIQNVKIAFPQAHVERGHVEPVSDEHGSIAAPLNISRRATPPYFRVIDYVIVYERRGVEHFHDRSHADRRWGSIASGHLGRKQEQGRSDSLTPTVVDVACHAGHVCRSIGGITF